MANTGHIWRVNNLSKTTTLSSTGLGIFGTPTTTLDATGDLVIRSTTSAENTLAPKGLYARFNGNTNTGIIQSIDKTNSTLYPL